MSKIDYPKQSDINRQIQTIIKASGMFEDDLTYNGFTELKPIQKKNGNIIRLIKIAASVAAIISLIVLIDFMRKPMSGSVQPLTRYETVKKGNQTNQQELNSEIESIMDIQYISSDRTVEYKNSQIDDIEFELNGKIYNSAEFSNKFDTSDCGRLQCYYPLVVQSSVDGSYINTYYENVVKSLEKRIYIEYLRSKILNQYNPIAINYSVNGENTQNKKIVTFLANEQIITNNENTQIEYNNKYAKTFSLETGKPVELNEIFSEYDDKVIACINEHINEHYEKMNNSIDRNVESDGIAELDGIAESDGIADASNEEFNWYITSEGIVFLLNNMYYNNGVEGNVQNFRFGSVLISYSDFYKQGIRFNSAYINYEP